MKLLIEFFEIIEGVKYTHRCILDKFETDEFFTYNDYLHLFPTGNIIGECDDKGRIIPNRYNLDLSKYEDTFMVSDLCLPCQYKDRCKKHRHSVANCQVRQLAAMILQDCELVGNRYYAVEDTLVSDLISLSDTYFKWSVLVDPVKNILKGGE